MYKCIHIFHKLRDIYYKNSITARKTIVKMYKTALAFI